MEKQNKRNQTGVKWFCDQYRTINGHHYECWADGLYRDLLLAEKARLEAQGHHVRRIKDSLYVRV